jgi:hypothetical protein
MAFLEQVVKRKARQSTNDKKDTSREIQPSLHEAFQSTRAEFAALPPPS